MDEEIHFEQGLCSLLIYGDRIDFERLKQILNREPTATAQKGEALSAASSDASETNGWFLDFEFAQRDELSPVLKKLLLSIYPHKEQLQDMLKEEDTKIFFKIYVNSNFAEVSYEIGPDVLSLLAEFGFPVKFSIFSGGLVEDR
jgi:hypothetical protein